MRINIPLSLRLPVLAALAVALITVAAAREDVNAASHPIVWGDVTCDNVVDLQDVADLMRRSSGLETATNCPGDVPPAAALAATTPDVTLRLDPPVASAVTGDTITISIFSDVHAAGTGLGNASFDLVFDPNALTPIACVANNGDCKVTYTPTTTRFGFLDGSAAGWTGTRKLGQVQYLVRGSSGSTSISFGEIEAGDQKGNSISSDSIGATISIGGANSTPTPAPSPGPSIRPGTYWYYADINCDSQVNVLDALSVLSYLAVGESGFSAAGSCPTIGS